MNKSSFWWIWDVQSEWALIKLVLNFLQDFLLRCTSCGKKSDFFRLGFEMGMPTSQFMNCLTKGRFGNNTLGYFWLLNTFSLRAYKRHWYANSNSSNMFNHKDKSGERRASSDDSCTVVKMRNKLFIPTFNI